MIAIYVSPDQTQVVRAKLHKKERVVIQQTCRIAQSFLPQQAYETDDGANRCIDCFIDLFQSVSEQIKLRKDDVYLVLPDYLFSMIDCFSFETEDGIREHIRSVTQKNLEEICYAKPILTAPEPQQRLVTVCALPRKLIDCIYEAADEEQVRLVSIESAGISFLRCTGVFNKEELVLQSYQRQATFTGYSSNGGLFKLDAPELSVENLGHMTTQDADRLIRQYMVEFESVAHQTFEFLNQDLPYTLLMPLRLMQAFPVFRERKATAHHFPDYIDPGNIPEEEDELWMCAVGTLAQDIDFSSDAFLDVLDAYENIQSGNVLPEDILKSTQKYQKMQKALRYTKFGILGMSALTVLELGAIFFLSNVQIPPGLEQDYQSAQSSMDSINKELDLIHTRQKEHEYPVEAYAALLADLPEGIGFNSIEIGDANKKDDSKWIKAKVVAADPLKFQDYVASLSRNALFNGVSIPQIASDSSTNYKTADLTVGKGNLSQ